MSINYKQTLISFLSGVIITAVITTIIASNYYKKHPIIITKESHTTTEVTQNPKDYNECLECLNSKGEISEKMNENVMHIVYKDKCKTAFKDVTLKSIDLKRNFLTVQVSNTIYENSYQNYGGIITYSYMLWDKIGISCGISANLKSMGISAGISYGW